MTDREQLRELSARGAGMTTEERQIVALLRKEAKAHEEARKDTRENGRFLILMGAALGLAAVADAIEAGAHRSIRTGRADDPSDP